MTRRRVFNWRTSEATGMTTYLLRCLACGARTDHPVRVGTFQEQLETLRDVWARRCDECGGRLVFTGPDVSRYEEAKQRELGVEIRHEWAKGS